MIRTLKKYYLEVLLVLPLVLFLFSLTLVPIIRTVQISFTSSRTGDLTLANYADLFRHSAFRQAFLNTLIIALGSLSIEIGMGMVLALVLSWRARYVRFLRPLFILPLAVPTVVVGVMMSYLFSSGGWVNRILRDLSLIAEPVFWMQGGFKSQFMVMIADSWKVTPLVMLMLLAGLQSIDSQLYRAARIDGARAFQIFRRITFPLLLPFITMAVIIRGIDAFRIFALPLILMGHNLKVIGTYAYFEYMEYNNPGLSAASSVLLLLMILFAIAVYIRATGKKGVQAA